MREQQKKENGAKDENEKREGKCISRLQTNKWLVKASFALNKLQSSIFSSIPDVLCAVRAANCKSSNRDPFW
jgi:hypothetical protein